MELPIHHNFKDKTGLRFGKLVVQEFAGRMNRVYYWKCLCDCGNESFVAGSSLSDNPRGVKSCGCVFSNEQAGPKVPVEERVAKAERETPYKVKDHRGGVADRKWVFICEKHGPFESNYVNVVVKGHRCPLCSRHGFQRQRESYFYILSIRDSSGLVGYKVGITTQDPKLRCSQIDAKSSFDVKNVVSLKYDTGFPVLELEKQVLSKYRESLFDKNLMEVGYTETIKREAFKDVLSLARRHHFHEKHRKLGAN